jgi:hypothetical protein
MINQERIICAAIKHKDHGIFCGYRHGKCINQASKHYHNTGNEKTWEQGFITTDNGRFVNREEAWAIADAAGQIINREHGIVGTLFSENLY